MDAASEARLLDLLERQDITDCLHRYARGMDRFDKELLLSAYHPDAVDDHGTFVGSPAEFWDHFHAVHTNYNSGHHHSLSNISIDLQGDIAHVETYYLFESMNSDGSLTLHGGRFETYDDHRMATAGAVIGLVVPDVEVVDVATTGKTLPDFVGMWQAMLGQGSRAA